MYTTTSQMHVHTHTHTHTVTRCVYLYYRININIVVIKKNIYIAIIINVKVKSLNFQKVFIIIAMSHVSHIYTNTLAADTSFHSPTCSWVTCFDPLNDSSTYLSFPSTSQDVPEPEKIKCVKCAVRLQMIVLQYLEKRIVLYMKQRTFQRLLTLSAPSRFSAKYKR